MNENKDDLIVSVRPDTFDKVKGNTEILDSIKSLLKDRKTCPHVFLLHGPTGCGKTTIGRILATELGVVGRDFIEINSSNFRGIDTIRDIIDNSRYAPVEGAVRVYLMDECHKLTGDAQTAALKFLEDTPNHIYVILCTTNPEKLLKEFKGRCTQYQVQVLSESQMTGLVRRTVREIGETLDAEVIEAIVKSSDGYPRGALKTLEKVLSLPAENRLAAAKVKEEEATAVLELSRALIKPGVAWKEVSVILKGLKGMDAEEIRRNVLGYCSAVLLSGGNVSDQAAAVIECFWEPTYNIGMPGIVFQCYNAIK